MSLYLLGLAGIDVLSSSTALVLVAVLAAVLAAADRAMLPAIGAVAVVGGFIFIEYSTNIGVILAGGGGVIFLLGGLRHVGLRLRSAVDL